MFGIGKKKVIPVGESFQDLPPAMDECEVTVSPARHATRVYLSISISYIYIHLSLSLSQKDTQTWERCKHRCTQTPKFHSGRRRRMNRWWRTSAPGRARGHASIPCHGGSGEWQLRSCAPPLLLLLVHSQNIGLRDHRLAGSLPLVNAPTFTIPSTHTRDGACILTRERALMSSSPKCPVHSPQT